MNVREAASHFNYCAKTGGIRWRTSRVGRGCTAGRLAGTTTTHGYRAVSVAGRKFMVHRIIWVMHHGDIPEGRVIDHIDGDGLNNRIENLRLTTPEGNQRNSRVPITNTSGVMNVYWHKRARKFCVRVCGNHIGLYSDLDTAIAARDEARRQLDCHANHGRAK